MTTESGSEMPRCIATTRSGKPCRNLALEGHEYCYVHLQRQETNEVAAQEVPIQEQPQLAGVLDAAHALSLIHI